MPSQEQQIEQQFEFLEAHRRTLAVYLLQLAKIGESHVQPTVANGVIEARENIKRIKGILRSWGVYVEDHPDDEKEPSSYALLQKPLYPGMSLEIELEYRNYVREHWEEKLKIQEEINRESNLKALQFNALKELLALVYRLRNIVRDIIEVGIIANELMEDYNRYYKDFRECLFRERALLKDDLFVLLHDMKNCHAYIRDIMGVLERTRNNDNLSEMAKEERVSVCISNIHNQFKRLDKEYNSLVVFVQNKLGVI